MATDDARLKAHIANLSRSFSSWDECKGALTKSLVLVINEMAAKTHLNEEEHPLLGSTALETKRVESDLKIATLVEASDESYKALCTAYHGIKNDIASIVSYFEESARKQLQLTLQARSGDHTLATEASGISDTMCVKLDDPVLRRVERVAELCDEITTMYSTELAVKQCTLLALVSARYRRHLKELLLLGNEGVVLPRHLQLHHAYSLSLLHGVNDFSHDTANDELIDDARAKTLLSTLSLEAYVDAERRDEIIDVISRI